MKTKPLNPAMRERKRYLAFELISRTAINDPYKASDSIRQSMRELVGDLGLGEAGLIFLHNKYDDKLQRGVVRVEHNYLDRLRASLAFIKKIDNKKVVVRSVGASGVLKKLLSSYINKSSLRASSLS